MDLEQLRYKILNDETFVLAEAQRLRYIYRLKKEIRYAQTRNENTDTESVAEHVFGMHVLANYFFPIENTVGTADREKILTMITWHDIDEIETGDFLSHIKTEAHVQAGLDALPKVLEQFPESLRQLVEPIMDEYETRYTWEAKFVKAIDKCEPLFEIEGENYKKILHDNGNTLGDHWRTKGVYMEEFPYILRFAEVMTDVLEREGYFVPEK